MPNRYKTEAEKNGTKRRMNNWRLAQRDLGRKPHEIWATDEEYEKVKDFLAQLRGKEKAAELPAATGGSA